MKKSIQNEKKSIESPKKSCYIPQIPESEMQKIEKQVLKYYRFKIYWKQVAIKKYLEEHMGIKTSKLREIKKIRLQNGRKIYNLIY